MKENVKEWKIAVVGAGIMGRSIAQFFSMNGHKVNLYNRSKKNMDDALEQIKNDYSTLVSMKMYKEEDVPAALANLYPTHDLEEAVKDADMVVEVVAEDPAVKKDMFSKLDKLVRPDTVLATNTSSLNIYDIAEVSHPERVLITHFFTPAYVMPLMELPRGPRTSDEVANKVEELVRAHGKKVAKLNKPCPGFILNRMTFALVREAAYMVEQGWTSPEDIDEAIVSTFGVRYTFEGPFKLGDFCGIDIFAHLLDLLSPTFSNATEAPKLLKDMIEAGDTGLKGPTGNGFYKHADANADRRERDAKIMKSIKFVNEEL
jgi:3-hydroxybutyryl-CoA dehydrogenase